MRVFVTVDTEFWPHTPGWQINGLHADYERDILGRTPSGEYGLRFQLDLLKAHGLKGVFLVEALSVGAAGKEFLERTVSLVRAYDQDVQLHAHTEWLPWLETPLLPRDRVGQHFHCFSLEEQVILLREALGNLQNAGAQDICGFRAGNYGANNDTLRAMRDVGLRIDTSYNYPYTRTGQCQMRSDVPLTQATVIENVHEYPISFFADWPGHYRHLQICACSAREMRTALLNAWEAGWQNVVIVSHSFELIDRRACVEHGTVVGRMEDLCRFLEREHDRFQTADFRDIAGLQPSAAPHSIIRGHVAQTVERYVQQAIARVR